MCKEFIRTEMLLGEESMKKLAQSRVAVFGLGGVGGYVVEALARSGVGSIDVIDNDKISVTNINRQILATHTTVGMQKTEAAITRIAEINPKCKVNAYAMFFLPENAGQIDFSVYDYVVDAIDTVAGKIAIAESAVNCGVPVVSCMGAGNKLDPTAFEVSDIYKTSVCPLARVMRRELKKRGIKKLKVIYSKEESITPAICADKAEINANTGRVVPGSLSFVPSVAGLIAAGEVIKDLTAPLRGTNC